MHICLFHVCLRWCAFILTFLNEIWHFPMQICHLICPSRGVSRLQNVLKFKNVWIWSERGGRNFSKMSEIQKVWNFWWGGGESSLFGNFPQIFLFFYDGSPNTSLTVSGTLSWCHLSYLKKCRQFWSKFVFWSNLLDRWQLSLLYS